jgi:hypothetical protein
MVIFPLYLWSICILKVGEILKLFNSEKLFMIWFIRVLSGFSSE